MDPDRRDRRAVTGVEGVVGFEYNAAGKWRVRMPGFCLLRCARDMGYQKSSKKPNRGPCRDGTATVANLHAGKTSRKNDPGAGEVQDQVKLHLPRASGWYKVPANGEVLLYLEANPHYG